MSTLARNQSYAVVRAATRLNVVIRVMPTSDLFTLPQKKFIRRWVEAKDKLGHENTLKPKIYSDCGTYYLEASKYFRKKVIKKIKWDIRN